MRGSIGIAMATTALIRRAAQHQNDLAGQLSPSNPILQQKSAQIAGYLAHRMGLGAAKPGSFGMIYGLMQQQSALKSYVDVFRWTALLAFFCAAAVVAAINATSPRAACSNRNLFIARSHSVSANLGPESSSCYWKRFGCPTRPRDLTNSAMALKIGRIRESATTRDSEPYAPETRNHMLGLTIRSRRR